MPIILLIRHGENDYVKEHRPAGSKAWHPLKQQRTCPGEGHVAKKLRKRPSKQFTAVPLERTMETAKPIAKALDLAVIPRQGLIETDVGEMAGEEDQKAQSTVENSGQGAAQSIKVSLSWWRAN